MTTYLFANNATTTLAAPISSSATSLTLASGAGSKFPALSAGQAFSITMKDSATGEQTEIMYCTARAGDVCTVVRGEEGTTAQAWTTGDFVSNTLTAGIAEMFLQAATFGTMASQNANAVAITGGAIDVPTLKVGGVNVMPEVLTTKGDMVVDNGTAPVRLAVGSNGQVLTADSTQADGLHWATPASLPLTTKGDLITDDGSGAVRLGVGSNGQVLTADSTATDGIKWAAPTSLTNPMTTLADLIVGGASGTPSRLAAGSAGQVLTVNPSAGLGVDWETPTGGGTNLQWVAVAGFTDTEMDAAVTTINASTLGGVVYLAPGAYNWTTTKTFTKPVTIIGCGCADQLMNAAITTVANNSTTLDCIAATVDPFQINDVHIKNTAGSAPTAGCGIHSTGHNGGHKLTNVTVQGFWNDIQIDNQGEWSHVSVTVYGWVNWGYYIRNLISVDGGDMSLVNCFAIAATYNSAAAIRWESGGGLKITNLKINNRGSFFTGHGIDVEIAASATTSDFLLSNSSIENVTGSPIKMRNGSGGTLPNVVIHGIQMANYSTSLSPVDIVASSTGIFDRLILDDLNFTNGSSSVAAINLQNIDNVAIGVCVKNSAHALLVSASGVTTFRNVNSRLGTFALTDGATVSIDLANCENFRLTLGGNRTLANPTNATGGQMVNIRVHQDATGSRTLGYGTKYKFPGGTAPVLSTAASAADMLSFQYDDSEDTYWLVAVKAFA